MLLQELSSLYSQRAQGDKQTISLSGILITTIREKRKDVLGRENIFICFLHAETTGSTCLRDDGGGDRIRAELASSGAETTSERNNVYRRNH